MTKSWVVKPIRQKKDKEVFHAIVKRVEEAKKSCEELFVPESPDLPQNIAPTPKPVKTEAIKAHASRGIQYPGKKWPFSFIYVYFQIHEYKKRCHNFFRDLLLLESLSPIVTARVYWTLNPSTSSMFKWDIWHSNSIREFSPYLSHNAGWDNFSGSLSKSSICPPCPLPISSIAKRSRKKLYTSNNAFSTCSIFNMYSSERECNLQKRNVF